MKSVQDQPWYGYDTQRKAHTSARILIRQQRNSMSSRWRFSGIFVGQSCTSEPRRAPMDRQGSAHRAVT